MTKLPPHEKTRADVIAAINHLLKLIDRLQIQIDDESLSPEARRGFEYDQSHLARRLADARRRLAELDSAGVPAESENP